MCSKWSTLDVHASLGVGDGRRAKSGCNYLRKELGSLPSRTMAHPTRFERVASTFGGWRSIQLSYGCISLSRGCWSTLRFALVRYRFSKSAYAMLTRRIFQIGQFTDGLLTH